MAIRFEPMSPYSDAVSQATGAMDQQEKNRQFQMQNFNVLSDAAAKQHQQAMAEAKLVQDNEQFGAGLYERQRSQESSQQHQIGMEGMHADRQQEAIRLQSEMQQRLQQSQFDREATYADKLRLQEMEQGIATVRSMWQQGTITDEQMAQHQSIYDQGANPLRAMIQQTQIRGMVSQAEQADAINRVREQSAAQNGPNGHYRLPDPNNPNGHLPGLYWRNPQTGQPMLVPGTNVFPDGMPRFVTRPDGSEWAISGPGERPIQTRPPAPERPALTPQIRLRALQMAETAMNNEVRAAQQAGRPAPAWAANEDARTAAIARRARIYEQQLMDAPGSQAAPAGTAPQNPQSSADWLPAVEAALGPTSGLTPQQQAFAGLIQGAAMPQQPQE